jgi:hypothetical protein
MSVDENNRKLKYYFALYGDISSGKPSVESGRYVDKGYISSQNIEPGDIMLLYCTLKYGKYSKESPGIGIVINVTEDCVFYQYLPFDDTISLYKIKDHLVKFGNRLQVLQSRGNWLFEIDRESFRNVVENRKIDWP